eukprot:2459192-Prymnesium_polylepis.1
MSDLHQMMGFPETPYLERPDVEHRLPDGSLATPEMTRELGTIYRKLLDNFNSADGLCDMSITQFKAYTLDLLRTHP